MGAGADAVDGVLKNLQGLRNEMAHLCTNLQAYLMFEVLERAWTQFTTRIATAPDLDSLIGVPPPSFVPFQGFSPPQPHRHVFLWPPDLAMRLLCCRVALSCNRPAA